MSSAQRSEAPKRSAARSKPTRAQRGTRPKVKLFFRFNILHFYVLKFYFIFPMITLLKKPFYHPKFRFISFI
ncbi:MAG: hypothetical protein NZ455_09935 [Bacteroidia bacterium]|nr:hypothetical protein [Bacteroidia bacterium]MDW8347921.1 hypothetical protein [Bacteroidia bacterium]